MSADGEIERLRAARDRELAALRGSVENMAAALPGKPAEWIGEHPYAATLSAAAAGLLAAQFAFRRPARRPRQGELRGRRISHHNGDGDGSAARTSRITDLLEILLALAEPLLKGRAAQEEVVGGMRAGDAGAAAGVAFPGTFAAAGGKQARH